MDIILLVLGIICLSRNKYDWVIFLILLLASTYMQMFLPEEFTRPIIPIPHQVLDTALLLYLCLFLKVIQKCKLQKIPIVTTSTIFLFLYYFIAAFWDKEKGVLIGDIILYLRGYFLFTFVFIANYFSQDTIISVLKKTYYATLIICGVVLFQRFTNFEVIPFEEIPGRGVKAPIFAIFCGFLALINAFKVKRKTQLLHIVVFLLPIVLNSKMTYLMSVVFLYVLYVNVRKGFNVFRGIAYVSLTMIAFSILLFFFPALSERLDEFQTNMNQLGTVEYGDNFSYRIAHAYERLLYVINGGFYEWFHGVGFIHESHYRKNTFMVGLTDDYGNVIQLDTGDMAWSIMFVRLGIIGTCIFISFIISIIIRLMKIQYWGIMFSCYLLVALLFQSLGNSVLVDPFFYILPILFTGGKILKNKV